MSAGPQGSKIKASNDLSLLAPAFHKAVTDAIAECNGPPHNLDAFVFEAYRSQELQAIYYARGRTVVPPTRPVTNAATNLNSWHGYGLAVDVIHRTQHWDPPGKLAWFRNVAAIFKRHGCAWGGDWTNPDPPHMQWGLCKPSPSDEARRLIREQGVRAVWIKVGAAEELAGPPPPSPIVQPVPPQPAPALVRSTRQLAWGRRVSPAFRAKVRTIASGLGVEASNLMACMAFESAERFSPSVPNAAGSGAVGLIQFMPETAHALGTSTALLARMTAEAQLDYVELYFRPYRRRLRDIGDLYMAILFPRGVGQPDSFVLFDRADRAHPLRYRLNAGLDANGSGTVTKFEACAKVRVKLALGFKEQNVWID